MDRIDVSTSKNVLFACTFLSGVVAKIYDDLVDNYRLHKFSNPALLEVLKGVFMLTVTFTGIFNPLWFVMLWTFNFCFSSLEPLSYLQPYEKSIYISSSFLFGFINYDKLYQIFNDVYSSLFEVSATGLTLLMSIVAETLLRKTILLPSVPQNIKDTCNIEKEVSLFKLVETIVGVFVCLIILYYIKNTTNQLFVIWFLGYAIIRVCSQIYSLFVYKPKSFPLVDPLEKQNISKEPFTKEESEPKVE